jgi:hypothetical protein
LRFQNVQNVLAKSKFHIEIQYLIPNKEINMAIWIYLWRTAYDTLQALSCCNLNVWTFDWVPWHQFKLLDTIVTIYIIFLFLSKFSTHYKRLLHTLVQTHCMIEHASSPNCYIVSSVTVCWYFANKAPVTPSLRLVYNLYTTDVFNNHG